MKTEDLEKHIRLSRGNIDLDEPDERKIWKGIEDHFKHKEQLKRKVIYWRAAAILILLLATGYVLFYDILSDENLSNHANLQMNEMYHQDLYDDVIEYKWQEVKNSPLDIEDFPWLMEELEEIERVHLDYVKDLEKLGERPEIRRALENYYMQKTRLLDRLLTEIEKKQNYEERKEFKEIMY